MRIKNETPMELAVGDGVNWLLLLLGIGLAIFGLSMLPGALKNLSSDWAFVVIPLLMSLMVFFFVTRRAEFVFSKSSNKITNTQMMFWMSKTTELPLDGVEKIELREQREHTSKGGSYTFQYLVVMFKDTPELELRVPGMTSSNSGMLSIIFPKTLSTADIGAKLAAFLSVPFEQKRAPTLQETLAAVQKGISDAALKYANEHPEQVGNKGKLNP